MYTLNRQEQNYIIYYVFKMSLITSKKWNEGRCTTTTMKLFDFIGCGYSQ
jgi:hypothetical protein